MSYLTCPSCRFTVSRAVASSPFHNCPRCALREGTKVAMVTTTRQAKRFTRSSTEFERIAEAKARLARAAARGANPA